MKVRHRFLVATGILLVAVTHLIFADSSVTETIALYPKMDYYKTTLDCITDTDGSFTAYTLGSQVKGWILQMDVYPDTSAAGAYPTDQFDITITNSRGIDIFGGAASDIDSSTAKITLPTPDGTNISPVFNQDDLSFDILNNSVNGATIRVDIYSRLVE